MKSRYLSQRLFVFLVSIILFSSCWAILGIDNAAKFTILLLMPIFVITIGFFFLGKSLLKKGSYSNLLVIGIPALIFFAFTFLGSAFDPKNHTPFGINTFLISGAAGTAVLLLGLMASAVQKLLKKQ